MLLHFDATLIVILVSFIIFAIIMNKIFYLPMRRVIEERDDYIFINIDEATKINVNAQEIVNEYNQKIKTARISAQESLELHTNKAKEEKSKLILGAKTDAHKEINTAKELLNAEKNVAIENLKKDVAPLAQLVVSKILGTTVAISGIDTEKVDKILRG